MSSKKSVRSERPSRLAIATDHGGFPLKQVLVDFLKKRQIEVVDLGPESPAPVDYPDYAVEVAEAVSRGDVEAGILSCGTGIGMSIVANKFPGVRAAVVADSFTAEMAKKHNNANILCLGGRTLKPDEAEKLVAIWLDTPFEGERHARRLEKIRKMEEKNFKP